MSEIKLTFIYVFCFIHYLFYWFLFLLLEKLEIKVTFCKSLCFNSQMSIALKFRADVTVVAVKFGSFV